jgi:uncharacterized Zn-binding protein involved in type VI secretion
MPGQGRLGDKAQIQSDAHGCPGCPHPGVGPAIAGSADVFVNGRPALRVDDVGIHAVCCGPNMWQAQQGSSTVFINGKAAYRKNDPSKHCGGDGKLIEGSDDVIVGDASGGGSSSSGSGSTTNSNTSETGQSAKQKQEEAKKKQQQQQQSQQQQQQKQKEKPKPAQAQWKIELADGTAVQGVKAKYAGPGGDEEKTGSSGNKSGLTEGDEYGLTLEGTIKVQGKLQDPDGNALANAKLHIERTWGPPSDVTTDGSGAFSVEGFIKDEPYEISVVSIDKKVSFKIEDEDGKAVAGLKVSVSQQEGITVEGTSDASGKVEVEGLWPGEPYDVVVTGVPKVTIKLVDDDEKTPKAGVSVRVTGDSGLSVDVTSDGGGKVEIEGLMPGETFNVEIDPKDDDDANKKKRKR